MSMKFWLTKATFTSAADLASKGELSPTQAKAFLRVAIAASVMLGQNRIETSMSTKFEVPRISFGSRILKKGTEATRLTDGNRVKPSTAMVTLSTYLFRGETFISDEALEDSVERGGLADTMMSMLAEAVGRDVEQLGLLNNTTRATTDTGYAEELDMFDGLIKQLVGRDEADATDSVVPAAQRIDDGSSYSTFDSLFAALIEKMPSQYMRDPKALRFYISVQKANRYAESLGLRGTNAGDRALLEGIPLTYRGIKVEPVPMLTGADYINSGTVNMTYDNVAFLTHPMNIIWGFHRRIKVEKWRDPRDGATSFLPSVRMDVKIADPNFVTTAKKVSGL